jgi:hypothetical protein
LSDFRFSNSIAIALGGARDFYFEFFLTEMLDRQWFQIFKQAISNDCGDRPRGLTFAIDL